MIISFLVSEYSSWTVQVAQYGRWIMACFSCSHLLALIVRLLRWLLPCWTWFFFCRKVCFLQQFQRAKIPIKIDHFWTINYNDFHDHSICKASNWFYFIVIHTHSLFRSHEFNSKLKNPLTATANPGSFLQFWNGICVCSVRTNWRLSNSHRHTYCRMAKLLSCSSQKVSKPENCQSKRRTMPKAASEQLVTFSCAIWGCIANAFPVRGL